MPDANAIELIKRSEQRFAARQQLDDFRHEVALNFCPWHASWTSPLTLGDDFAAHLVDSTPILLARDFIGQIGSMLRPPGKQWFWHKTPLDLEESDREIREYLEWRSKQMMRITFDRVTGAHRAFKMGDEFFGFFGDAVLSVDLDKFQESLRLQAHHTRDVVWAVGDENKVDTVTRREHLPARVIKQRFKKVHRKIEEACEKNPDQVFEIQHHVMPVEDYDYYNGKIKGKPGTWASVWTDVDNKTILRETNTKTMRYVVPRWVTLPGWAYAISPATTVALPDARLIQQQALAIMEAAEKQINPPLIAVSDSIRGDVRLESRGLTWVERNYDERTGDPLRPIELGKNFQLGVDSLLRTEAQITRAFFLDVLRMPDTRNSKSTLEVQFKIDEYVRAALPLFAPMQAEYNEAVLHEVDAIIQLAGGYSMREMPDSLKETELLYQWDNPLSEMLERQKAQMVAEVSQLGQTIAALEAAATQAPALKQIDTAKMFREAVMGIGGAPWVLDENEAKQMGEELAQANAAREMVQAGPDLAKIVDSGVGAAEAASNIPNPAEPSFPVMPPLQ